MICPSTADAACTPGRPPSRQGAHEGNQPTSLLHTDENAACPPAAIAHSRPRASLRRCSSDLHAPRRSHVTQHTAHSTHHTATPGASPVATLHLPACRACSSLPPFWEHHRLVALPLQAPLGRVHVHAARGVPPPPPLHQRQPRLRLRSAGWERSTRAHVEDRPRSSARRRRRACFPR